MKKLFRVNIENYIRFYDKHGVMQHKIDYVEMRKKNVNVFLIYVGKEKDTSLFSRYKCLLFYDGKIKIVYERSHPSRFGSVFFPVRKNVKV